MKKSDMPASPIFNQHGHSSQYKGLTKREHFAGLAMQSLLKTVPIFENSMSPAEIAGDACVYADALLAELDKGE